jgi:hypothetical protein
MNINLNAPSFGGKYIVKGSIDDVNKVEENCRNNRLDINSLSTLRLKYGQDKCIEIFATNEDSVKLTKAKRDKNNPVTVDKSKNIKENMLNILKRVFKKDIANMPIVKAEEVLDVPPKRNQYRYFDFEEGHFFGKETVLLDGTKEEYTFVYDEENGKGLKSRTDKYGVKTEYYPSSGKLKSIAKPDGSKKEYYDDGKVKSVTTAEGAKTNYSVNGKVTTTVAVDGTVVTYWGNGNMKSMKLPEGPCLRFNQKGILQ